MFNMKNLLFSFIFIMKTHLRVLHISKHVLTNIFCHVVITRIRSLFDRNICI